MVRISLGPGSRSTRHPPEHLALRLHHIRIARPENFQHRRDALRPVSQRRHGLRAAHLVNLRRAGELQRVEQRRIHRARLVRRRGDDDLRHARGLGQRAGHQRRGDQRRRAARHINSHALKGIEPLAHLRSLPVFPGPAFAQALQREVAHVRVRRPPPPRACARPPASPPPLNSAALTRRFLRRQRWARRNSPCTPAAPRRPACGSPR